MHIKGISYFFIIVRDEIGEPEETSILHNNFSNNKVHEYREYVLFTTVSLHLAHGCANRHKYLLMTKLWYAHIMT